MKAVCLEPATGETTAMRSPRTSAKHSPRSQQPEKSSCSSDDPAQPKINKSIKKKKNSILAYFVHCSITSAQYITQYSLRNSTNV